MLTEREGGSGGPGGPGGAQPPAGAARMGSSEDDKGLVTKTLAGERDAFGVLVERYAAQARRVARAVLGDPDDADDAAQDGFLSALVKLAQYDTRRPFGPWLMRIVANAATDRRRRRNVRQAEPLDPALVGGGPRPDAVAIRNELGPDRRRFVRRRRLLARRNRRDSGNPGRDRAIGSVSRASPSAHVVG